MVIKLVSESGETDHGLNHLFGDRVITKINHRHDRDKHMVIIDDAG